MFTGIIAQLGIVKSIRRRRNLIILGVDTGKLSSHIKTSNSVAINGVCLTATDKKGRVVSFDLMKETIEKTSLKQIGIGSGVNLELAMRANSRFGGHFVTGHVDEVGIIKDIFKDKNWVEVIISVSRQNHKYIAPKGSVAVDGISLTVGKVGKNHFSVYLIPYTLKVTNLGRAKVGEGVNIETDILAKYIRA